MDTCDHIDELAISSLVKGYGTEAAVEVVRFEAAQLQEIEKIVSSENVDCDFKVARSYDVWTEENAAKEAKTAYENIRSHGVEFVDDAKFILGDEAERVSAHHVASPEIVHCYHIYRSLVQELQSLLSYTAEIFLA